MVIFAKIDLHINYDMDVVRVIALTDDFKLAYNVRIALEVSPFIFKHLMPNDKIKDDDIIIQSIDDIKVYHPLRIVLSRNDNKTRILSKIYAIIEGETKITIGIDPGKTIGVAILQNASVVNTSSFSDIRKVEIWIRENIRSIAHNDFTIKIGNSGGEYNEPIIDYIHKQFHEEARIEIVDEYNSSRKRSKRNIPRIHENAAIYIAKRNRREN